MIACFHATSASAQCGGPLYVSPNGPIVWKAPIPIPYKIGRDPAGNLPDAGLQKAIETAFGAWNAVPTTAIRFKFNGFLGVPVDSLQAFKNVTQDLQGGGVVVFDANGAILEEALGNDNSRGVYGITKPIRKGNEIVAFYSLINGKMAANPQILVASMIHEFGHVAGLDHSQVNADIADGGDKAAYSLLPAMFPVRLDPQTQTGMLMPDDVAWISMLYPAPPFRQKYGVIRGRVDQDTRATPRLGANVVAIRIQGQTESLVDQFSCVTDWLGNGDGQFSIPVTPGVYKLRIEAVRPAFCGASSVGPHAKNARALSFAEPVNPSDLISGIVVNAGVNCNLGVLVEK
jgi:hypothetical protein